MRTKIEDIQDIKPLEGKTIESIDFPRRLKFFKQDWEVSDQNIQITFTDGTILKLGSWDYEGYKSGIYKEIITID
jgi:hypothetical protein